METIVIYHRADFDGIFCREIAKRFFGARAEYIGWDYGDALPAVPSDAQLYMLDISIDGMMQHANLVWIDHHASAIAKYSPQIPGCRIDGVAACRLSWQCFFGLDGIGISSKEAFIAREVNEPLAVRLAGEYDIWDKRDPRAELFQHGLRSCEVNFQWLLDGATGEADEYLNELLDRGRALQFAKANENDSTIKAFGFTLRFENLTFLACNAARYNSHLFRAGLQPQHDGCLGFNWNGEKKKWRVSLYGVPGKPDVNLAAIAVKYGGGGHKQACGFESDFLPFGLTP